MELENKKCFIFHDWGKWGQYKVGIKIQYPLQNEWHDTVETRQRRFCKRCNKMQDEKAVQL
jgi:hypothetical protein